MTSSWQLYVIQQVFWKYFSDNDTGGVFSIVILKGSIYIKNTDTNGKLSTCLKIFQMKNLNEFRHPLLKRNVKNKQTNKKK